MNGVTAGAGRARLFSSVSASRAANEIAGASISTARHARRIRHVVPEVIEVEPVVRRQARIVCQPICKPLQYFRQCLGAPVSVDAEAVSEYLEVQVLSLFF